MIEQKFDLLKEDSDFEGIYKWNNSTLYKNDLVFNNEDRFSINNITVDCYSAKGTSFNEISFEQIKDLFPGKLDYRVISKRTILIYKQNLQSEYKLLLNSNKVYDYERGANFLNFITADAACIDFNKNDDVLKSNKTIFDSSTFLLSKSEIVKKYNLDFSCKIKNMKDVTCYRYYGRSGDREIPLKEFYFYKDTLKLIIEYSSVKDLNTINPNTYFIISKESDCCRNFGDDSLAFFPNDECFDFDYVNLLQLYSLCGGLLKKQKFYCNDYSFFFDIYANHFTPKENYFRYFAVYYLPMLAVLFIFGNQIFFELETFSNCFFVTYVFLFFAKPMKKRRLFSSMGYRVFCYKLLTNHLIKILISLLVALFLRIV